jgi:hypothetical protein
MASSRLLPHISLQGCSEAQTFGRSGELNILQRIFSSRWIQGIPAALPSGIPGMDELMEGAMQQAPQKALHSIAAGSDIFIILRQSKSFAG